MTVPDDPIPFPPQRKVWSGQEYDRLVALGAFDQMRVELIDGELYEISPMGENHGLGILLAQHALMKLFPPDQFSVKTQIPFRLNSRSRPEPDIAVYRGSLRETASFDLQPLLAVEIADSSLDFDRGIKLPAYASRQIQEVWIINLRDQVIEAYRGAHEIAGDKWAYDPAVLTGRGQEIATLILPDQPIAAADILP